MKISKEYYIAIGVKRIPRKKKKAMKRAWSALIEFTRQQNFYYDKIEGKLAAASRLLENDDKPGLCKYHYQSPRLIQIKL